MRQEIKREVKFILGSSLVKPLGDLQECLNVQDVYVELHFVKCR